MDALKDAIQVYLKYCVLQDLYYIQMEQIKQSLFIQVMILVRADARVV